MEQILPNPPYSVNTIQFQKCIQRQVQMVTFHTRPDRFCIVIVDTESQAMLTLKDLFKVSSDTELNTCTGIFLIPSMKFTQGALIADCSCDLFDQVTFKEQDLPDRWSFL